MKLIKYAFWAVIAVCLIIVGMANRGVVTLRAMPEALAGLAGVSPDIELPLFMVILLGVGVGLLIGFVWEWLREYKFRAAVSSKDREVRQLNREVSRLKADKHGDEDDVLALLDGAGARS